MAKYTLTIAGKDDKIFNEGFTISKKDNLKPRFKLGTQEDADKFNKGGVEIVLLSEKKQLKKLIY